MTNTNKDKIRVKRYISVSDKYSLKSEKLTVEEFKSIVSREIENVIEDILFTTGEDFIVYNSGSLQLAVYEDINDRFSFDTTFNLYYSALESNEEYQNRLKQLTVEEAQMKQLAAKFGYKLEKVND